MNLATTNNTLEIMLVTVVKYYYLTIKILHTMYISLYNTTFRDLTMNRAHTAVRWWAVFRYDAYSHSIDQ